ncbi:single-stranded DNA-binding protein [Clostridium felsineum]|uniref:single-stranded DNA-binding protein n=1 Tax=Clostridium felsineum TaxID=36839 RepID=UPI00098BDEB4|nr:single-stranded DNA-binding protein [Clostridium felsineum]URZ15529.1 Single-stranded DNA-binding protein B [Clostridium felsineum DSM 794]
MNKILLIGRMTKDPSIKQFENTGNNRCNFTIAVRKRTKNNNGENEADFISITVWGKTAENVAKYMKKGYLVGVSGRLQVRSYDDVNGNKKYITEVVGEEVQFLESKKEAV